MCKPFISCLAASLLFVAGGAFGQTAAGRPAFEVASIKPAAPLDMQKVMADMQEGKMPKVGPRVDGARAEYSYMGLKELIALAYKVKANQITGPDWLANERFDIVAKIPNGASKDDAPLMLQALLEERFKLVIRRETKEQPVLALLVGKGGPKLKESPAPVAIDENAPLKPGERKFDTPDGPIRVSTNPDGSSTMNMGAKGTLTQKMDMEAQMMHMEASMVTMEGFADMLTSLQQLGGAGAASSRRIVDMTELKGNFQITLDISLADIIAMARAQGVDKPEFPAAGANPVVTASDPAGGRGNVFAAVQALGLKLEPRNAKLEQLVIASMEKTPTEN